MKYIISLTIFLFLACGTTSKLTKHVQNLKLEITGIKEFEYAYGIKALNKETNKLIYIVSHKENFYNKHKLKKPVLHIQTNINIIKGKEYNFKLLPIKPLVSQVQDLGAYIVVEKDTLISGENYKEIPFAYSTINTIGLKITH